MWRFFPLGFLVVAVVALPGACKQQVLPQGIIPGPAEPGITVRLETDKESYAPGEYLTVRFTLSQEAWVYLYDVRPDGTVELLVPNRFLQEPRFPAGEHVLPTEGWRLRVTEPEGMEYLEIVATDRPLSFYDAKEFEEHPFLAFADPEAFSKELRELLVGAWGAAWTSFCVHEPKALLHLKTIPDRAEVWVNGELVGETPLDIAIRPGQVEIELALWGYRNKRFSLDLEDGEEVFLDVSLEPAPQVESVLRGLSLGPVTLGFTLGWGSFGVEVWGKELAAGMAIRPGPPPPSTTEPGPGGWYPWGPEIELYGAGWLPLGKTNLGVMVLAGVSVQEMAWLPGWLPAASLQPAVEVEPETSLSLKPTLGIGFGGKAQAFRAYLAWHTNRGPILGVVFNP